MDGDLLVTYWLRGAPLTVEGIVMTAAHLGMILQGVYLLTRFSPAA
ncbi:MAG: hypothetical protein HZY76_07055 [Anaerolineae bacterium]|nr:MAG: hypothetical protein HZY76_07055 [Anaerolineae bacterium]